jgi:branched-chain amino acid transport system permease protein
MGALAGALYAYYMTNVNADFFSINFAIQFIAIIIIGGMGSLKGSVIGAAVWLLLPAILTGFATQAGASNNAFGAFLVEIKPQLVNLIFGTIVILLLIFAPGGIVGLSKQWRNLLAPSRSE